METAGEVRSISNTGADTLCLGAGGVPKPGMGANGESGVLSVFGGGAEAAAGRGAGAELIGRAGGALGVGRGAGVPVLLAAPLVTLLSNSSSGKRRCA